MSGACGELAAEERRLLAHRAVEEAPPPRALDQLGEPLVAERRVLAARVEPPGAHPRLERVEATELGLQLAQLLLVRGVARAELAFEQVGVVAQPLALAEQLRARDEPPLVASHPKDLVVDRGGAGPPARP